MRDDVKVNYNTRSRETFWSLLETCSLTSPQLARRLELAGLIASFARWKRDRGLMGRRYRWREALWKQLVPQVDRGPWTALEFGVASGTSTRFWLGNVQNPRLSWHGFDLFTGLPTPWIRGAIEVEPAGAFDAGGQPPVIDDPRLTWHVGLVEETLPRLELDPDRRLLVLFDLDLYEPSATTLTWLEGKLKPGDLLYFDEAYDPWAERRLIDEFVAGGHRIKPIGSTATALAVEYVGGPSTRAP